MRIFMEDKKLWKDVLKALTVSVIVTIAFLVILSLAMLKSGWKETIVSKIMVVFYVLAPAVGGFILGKIRKVNRFLWGLLIGVVYFLLYFAVALCVSDAQIGSLMLVAIPVCLGGMAGGMLS